MISWAKSLSSSSAAHSQLLRLSRCKKLAHGADSRHNHSSTPPLCLNSLPAPGSLLYLPKSLLSCYQRNGKVPLASQNKRSNVFTKPPGNDDYRIFCNKLIEVLRKQGAGCIAQASLEMRYNMQILRASKVTGEVIAGGCLLRGTSKTWGRSGTNGTKP